MKHWLLAMALICLGVPANAATEVFTSLLGDCTSYSVSVASAPATQLLSASLNGTTTSFLRLMENRTFFEIQNSTGDATSLLYMQIGLSSTSASGDLSLTAPTALTSSEGITVAPGGTKNMPLASRNSAGRVLIPWVMRSPNATSGSVMVTQCKP